MFLFLFSWEEERTLLGGSPEPQTQILYTNHLIFAFYVFGMLHVFFGKIMREDGGFLTYIVNVLLEFEFETIDIQVKTFSTSRCMFANLDDTFVFFAGWLVQFFFGGVKSRVFKLIDTIYAFEMIRSMNSLWFMHFFDIFL